MKASFVVPQMAKWTSPVYLNNEIYMKRRLYLRYHYQISLSAIWPDSTVYNAIFSALGGR